MCPGADNEPNGQTNGASAVNNVNERVNGVGMGLIFILGCVSSELTGAPKKK